MECARLNANKHTHTEREKEKEKKKIKTLHAINSFEKKKKNSIPFLVISLLVIPLFQTYIHIYIHTYYPARNKMAVFICIA